MSLIITKNFKRAKAQDAAAQDAQFKERDDVFVKMPDGHEEEGTIVKVYTDHYDVKLWDSGVRAVGFSKVRAMTAANDTAKDSAELNNDADLRAALSKMADIAKRLTDAKVSFKAGWTPDGIGEIILDFPNIESARKYNYYKLFNAWDAARSQIVPRWAVNIGGYRVPRIEGNRMTISILHFST